MEKEKYLKKITKFSDEELIELHSKGYSDVKIAHFFGVRSPTTIFIRRAKLKLVANYPPFGGENLTKKGLINSRKKHLKDAQRRHNEIYIPKNKEKLKKWAKEYYKKNKQKILKKEKVYNQKNKQKTQNYRKNYQKKYYLENKLKINKKQRDYYQKNKINKPKVDRKSQHTEQSNNAR